MKDRSRYIIMMDNVKDILNEDLTPLVDEESDAILLKKKMDRAKEMTQAERKGMISNIDRQVRETEKLIAGVRNDVRSTDIKDIASKGSGSATTLVLMVMLGGYVYYLTTLSKVNLLSAIFCLILLLGLVGYSINRQFSSSNFFKSKDLDDNQLELLNIELDRLKKERVIYE